MKPPFSYVPALPAAVGMMAGIVLFSYLPSPLIAAAAIFAAAVAFILHRHWLAFGFSFLAIGIIVAAANYPKPPLPDLLNTKALWSACLTDSKTTASATRLTAEIDSCNSRPITEFKCAILIPTVYDQYQPGDRITFSAAIFDPRQSPDLPDENSYGPTYYVEGITAQANVSPDDISVVSSSPSLTRTARSWQASIRDLIYRSPVSAPTAWFLSATLLADDSMLDPAVKQQFRATGVAHYLALSGFHIGIIALIASIAFFPMKIWSRFGRLRHLAVITIIWLYAFICGLSPSLVRAAVMISLFLLAKVLQRRSSPYNSLCVAALTILVFAPRQLFSPGFQLSFCAVLAILLFARPLNPFSNPASIKYKIASLVTVPIAAMAGTSIITIVHFHHFPLLFLIPNLIFAILLPLTLGAGIIMIITTAIGLRLTFLGAVTDAVYNSVMLISDAVASIDGAELRGIFLPPLVIIIGLIAIILLAFALNLRKRILLILSATAFSTAFLLSLFPEKTPCAELYITRRPLRTDIIIRDGRHAVAITTAPQHQHPDITRRLNMLYADFLAKRNCSDTLLISDTDFSFPNIKRRGEIIIFNDKTLMLLDRPRLTALPDNAKINYLVVTRAAGNKVWPIIKAINPDTLIITRDTPPVRASRLIDSCRVNSIPVIHLIDTPFKLTR